MLISPPVCDFGRPAPGFTLPATDCRTLSYADVAGPNGTLIMFICNHCPYVLRVLEHIIQDTTELQAIGIGVAAISSNDVVSYPQDSFDNMQIMAEQRGFPFPYLYDEDQSVARAYDAACTPDFFGFNAQAELQYRGRLMSPGSETEPQKRELLAAMTEIAQTGRGPSDQVPSMGCSIKWKG